MGNVPNEAKFPFGKRGSFIPEDFVISDSPYIPACIEDNLSKKRSIKLSPCLKSNLNHIVPTWPFNLKVVLDPHTEVACKKEVIPVLSRLSRAYYTFRAI